MPNQIILTMVGFTVLYGALAVVEVMLMVHLIRKGPYPEEYGRPLHEPNKADLIRSRPSRRPERWKFLCPTKCSA
jgi:hypothetical protein